MSNDMTAGGPGAFALGREVADGEWRRQAAVFRDRVRADGSSPYTPDAGRYHLYLALACPWSHRVAVLHALKGLEGAIGVSLIHPYRDARGWAFPGGEYTDRVNGFAFLSEAYERSAPGYDGRVTVPVLWDTWTRRIVSNESADIVEMLNGEFDAVAGHPEVDFDPADLRPEVARLNERIYADVNNGVYACGFAGSQEAYETAFTRLFAALEDLEALLGERRYLAGDRPTLADWRLWVTLVRFDSVYHTHFRANGRRLVDHPNLWAHTRELYQWPGVAETVRMDEIKRHYYTTHDMLNPKRIIPAGPLDLDFTAPHGRDERGARWTRDAATTRART